MAFEQVADQAEALLQSEVLADAIDHLHAVWAVLGNVLALKLEGSQVPPRRVQAALDDVQAAEREANALVERALTTGGA